VKFDGLEGLVQVGAANVDGRLLVARRTGFVRRVEFAPGQGAVFAFVVPGRGGLGKGLGSGHRGQSKRKSGKYRKTHRSLLEHLDQ
jgi:hypothetical protein